MKFSSYLHIAWRQMMARKKQTILTLLGILLGSTGYVVISGIMLGFQEYLLEQLVNSDAHVKISSQVNIIRKTNYENIFYPPETVVSWKVPPSGRKDSQNIENAAYWVNRLRNDDDVLAFSQQVSSKAIFRRGKITESGRVTGALPHAQVKVSNIALKMTEGKFTDLGESGNRIIIGEGLRELLGARVSEIILLSNGKSDSIPFKIAGIFSTGNKTVDETMAWTNLVSGQKFNNSPGRISDIAVRLKDVKKSMAKAAEWRVPGDVKVQSWEEANASFLNVFSMQDIVRYAMTVSILVVAGFGIYNILNILITQKRREIAILRSMGFEARDIIFIFLIQGLVLGFAGGILGMLLGYVTCLQMEKISFAGPARSANNTIIVSFNIMIYVFAFLLAFVSTLFASIFPARNAGKMAPIDILREQA